MAHRVVLESSSSFLRIFFLNKNFQAGIGRWEPGPGSDGRGRTCSTSLQVGLSFWNSWWWQFNLQWHDSLPSLNFLVWKIKWGHCSGAGHPLIVSTLSGNTLPKQVTSGCPSLHFSLRAFLGKVVRILLKSPDFSWNYGKKRLSCHILVRVDSKFFTHLVWFS